MWALPFTKTHLVPLSMWMDLMEYINRECDKLFGQVAFCKVARGLLIPCFGNPPPWGLSLHQWHCPPKSGWSSARMWCFWASVWGWISKWLHYSMAERATGSQNDCSSLRQFALDAALKHCLTSLWGPGLWWWVGRGKQSVNWV